MKLFRNVFATPVFMAFVFGATSASVAEPGWWTDMKNRCRSQGGSISEYYNDYDGCHLQAKRPAESAPKPEESEDYRAGLEAERQHDWNRAIESYAAAVVSSPDNAEFQSKLQNAHNELEVERVLETLSSRGVDVMEKQISSVSDDSIPSYTNAAHDGFVMGTCAMAGDSLEECRDSGSTEAIDMLTDMIAEEAVTRISKKEIRVTVPDAIGLAAAYKRLKDIELAAVNISMRQLQAQFWNFRYAHKDDQGGLTSEERDQIAIQFGEQVEQWHKEAAERANTGEDWSQLSGNTFSFRLKGIQQAVTIARSGEWQGQ